MQLVLTILAGLGALLFIISFLGYVWSGFRHHFVTGLISMLPVLNIVTLPSLWDKNSGKFFVGLLGLVITAGAWFMGADKGTQQLLARGNNTVPEVAAVSNVSSNQSTDTILSKVLPTSSQINTKSTHNLDESNMIELPHKALYRMGFDEVPINQINTLQGRIVQIINVDNQLIEGRLKAVAPGSVVIDGLFENELPIASIKKLKLMVKKSN